MMDDVRVDSVDDRDVTWFSMLPTINEAQYVDADIAREFRGKMTLAGTMSLVQLNRNLTHLIERLDRIAQILEDR